MESQPITTPTITDIDWDWEAVLKDFESGAYDLDITECGELDMLMAAEMIGHQSTPREEQQANSFQENQTFAPADAASPGQRLESEHLNLGKGGIQDELLGASMTWMGLQEQISELRNA
jgi:hypothetical protein